MVQVLQKNWVSIVSTLLCIHVYVAAEPPNTIVWKVLRRLMDDGGFPFSSVVTETNVSNIIDDGVRRARMEYTTTESVSSHHPSHRNNTKQKPNKHRFIVDFENEVNVSKPKQHSKKDYDRNENRPPKIMGYEGSIHPRVEGNDTIEQNKRHKAHSKSKAQQLRGNYQPETFLATMKNRTKGKDNQNDSSKLAERSGRFRDGSDEISLRNNNKPTMRITKMPHEYQLEDDADYVLEKKQKRNDRLNPYAIDRQMLRYMDHNRKNMNITMEVIGRTAEYNNIVLLKISQIQNKDDRNFRTIFEHKYADEPPEKKIIFIVHGLTVMGMGGLIHDENMFRTLMSYYAAHLPKFDIFVIPVANPDGYTAILNAQSGKFWNKNKSPQSSCSGVALDRNFDVEWNASHGISPCSHMYPGAAPFSEPETIAIRDILHLYSQKIIAYIHVHASTFDESIFKGDAVLYPRGYTSIQTDDDKYLDIKGDIEETMKNASFRVLSIAVEPMYYWYGKVVGTSVDYASSIYGIPYAMEFAMQMYAYLEKDALLQIWRRIIDVVFTNIAKNANKNYD